jgi:prophage regulatory protein
MSEKFLRLTEVQRRVPYSRSNLYLLMSRGAFPKNYALGARAVAWLESEISQWVNSRVHASRKGMQNSKNSAGTCVPKEG